MATLSNRDKIRMIGALLKIDNKGGDVVPFRFNRIQRYFHAYKGKRNIILKARQLGISSSILADMFTDCITYPHTQCAVISHEGEATKRLLDRVQFYYDSMGEPKPSMDAESRTEKSFPNHSSMYIGTAGCLHPDSFVLTEGGNVKPIGEVSVGDTVYRGRGRRLEKVTRVFSQSYKGKLLKLTVRGNPSAPLLVTPDHRFMVHKGWQSAEHITSPANSRGRRVCYFIKPITDKIRSIEGLRADYKLGWVFGLYLAEGWYGLAYTSFGLNSRGADLRDRLKSFADEHNFTFRWRLKGGIGENGMEVSVGSLPFMELIENILGKGKKVPDWFWDCGKDFLNGIVDGYVAGDGYEEEARTKITSVRPHLLYQLRDMLLSVRGVYSGIYKLTPRESFNGKMQNQQWELDFPLTRGVKFHKYRKSSRGKQSYEYVSLPLRVEEVNYSGLVYDISCSGSFSTPSCLVHNSRAFGHGDTIKKAHLSELAWYEEGLTVLNGVEDAVPLTGELNIESTPCGENNIFYERWIRAREGKSAYKTFFFPWWWDDGYRIPRGSDLVLPSDTGELDYTDEEEELVAKNDLGEDQIRWRRWKIGEKGALFWQEYPEDEVSCWIIIGDPVFDSHLLNKLASESRPGQYHEDGWTFWLAPEEGMKYIIGVDTSSGAPEGSYSAAVVLNERWEVCATFQARLEPHTFAAILKKMGKWYNEAELVVERNFTGYAVLEQLSGYGNVAYQRDFSSGRLMSQKGWWSSERSRELYMTVTKENLGQLKMWDVNLVRQLRSYRYIKLQTRYREQAKTHDDLAIALMLAVTSRKVSGTARGYRGSVPGWGW